MVARGGREVSMGLTANGYRVSFRSVGNVQEFDSVMIALHSEYTRGHWSVYFKMVNFM